MNKSYLYKVYRDDKYLGHIPNVTSDFTYSHEINSNSVSIIVDVEESADVAVLPVDPILDQSGDPIQDESGDDLYEERKPDVVGSLNPEALIQENNTLKVYEYSDEETNGTLVFEGWIESWAASMGGQNDSITFTAISKGVDLSDYVVKGPDQAFASHDVSNASFNIYENKAGSKRRALSALFFGGGGFASGNISAVKLYLSAENASNPCTFTVELWPFTLAGGLAPVGSAPLATGTQVVTSTSQSDYTIKFDRVLQAAGQYLGLVMKADAGSGYGGYIWYDQNGPFESLFVSNSTGTVYNVGVPGANATARLTLYKDAGVTEAAFSDTDPADIVRQAVDNYQTHGGVVTYTEDSIDNTGIEADYTFNVATIHEVVSKATEMAPGNWYWYVDPATQILYFKETPAAATHTFIKGSHFNEITIAGTVEDVKNVVYFTGGDLGSGTNLFKYYENAASKAKQGRQRLARISDGRVTVQATADLMANSVLEKNPGTVYSSPVTIDASSYDINSIKVGDTVKLAGYGNFLDNLMLQVARLTRRPDSIDLVLGVILQRQSDALTNILNTLNNIQTIDNPSAPS